MKLGRKSPRRARSASHSLSMTSVLRPGRIPGTDDGTGQEIVLANSTGWSSDGAPIGVLPDGTQARGEMRLFALGAIVQHFTKDLQRRPGIDFRVPSNLELDALLAFQLSLGRQKEANLASMTFKSPVVEKGKEVFQTLDFTSAPALGSKVGTSFCVICHVNAGATSALAPGPNDLVDSGVEDLALSPALLIKLDEFGSEEAALYELPIDGGFGKPKLDDVPYGPVVKYGTITGQGHGDGRFDSQVLIEAAATPPYFHDNSSPTLETAVSFYCSKEFNDALNRGLPPGFPPLATVLPSDAATLMSCFLRAIGCAELIERSMQNNVLAKKPSTETMMPDAYFIEASMEHTKDAIKVLKEGTFMLCPEAQDRLQKALDYQKLAQLTFIKNARGFLLDKANGYLAQAKGLIYTGPALYEK
jgi:hypothetical protein